MFKLDPAKVAAHLAKPTTKARPIPSAREIAQGMKISIDEAKSWRTSMDQIAKMKAK
jgi:hypothetical protein